MSEQDQGATSTATDTTQGGGDQAQTNGGAGDQWFLDAGTSKYRDKDEAARGFAEKDRYIADLKAQLDSRSSTLETIVAKLGITQEPQAPKRDIEAEMTVLESRLADAEPKEMLAIQRKIARLEAESLQEGQRAEMNRLASELSELRKRTAEYDPEWVESRDSIKRLSSEYGLDPNDPNDRKALMKIAAVEKKKNAQPARVMPSGGMGSSTGVIVRDAVSDSQNQEEASQIAGLLRIVGVNADVAKIKDNLKRRQP